MPSRMTSTLAAIATGLVLLAGCATNPATGSSDMAFMSEDSEIKLGKQMHVQITRAMGVYDDYALQQYVQQLGEKLAKVSERPNLEWKFTVLDTDDVNAFATPGGFVYISRGILPYLANEAQLAAVLGHEIGHITARHSVERQSQSTIAGVLSAAAVIFTGQPALGELTNIAGAAVISGYGREAELEADSLGARYLAKTGYKPEAMIEVVAVLKDQEQFERDRARAEGREQTSLRTEDDGRRHVGRAGPAGLQVARALGAVDVEALEQAVVGKAEAGGEGLVAEEPSDRLRERDRISPAVHDRNLGRVAVVVLASDAVVLVVVANPEPLDGVAFVEAKSAVVEADAYGPELVDPLDIPGRRAFNHQKIQVQQFLEITCGQVHGIFEQRPEIGPIVHPCPAIAKA